MIANKLNHFKTFKTLNAANIRVSLFSENNKISALTGNSFGKASKSAFAQLTTTFRKYGSVVSRSLRSQSHSRGQLLIVSGVICIMLFGEVNFSDTDDAVDRNEIQKHE